MPDLNDIKQSATHSDKWVKKRQKKHIEMVENAIQRLQDSIIDSLDVLETTSGNLDGVKINLKQAQKVHRDVEVLFAEEFNAETKKIINDFKNTKGALIKSYGLLDESINFTGVDETMMSVLRDGYYQDYLNLSGQYKDKVVQSIYDSVIGGGKMSDLVNVIQGTLLRTGATDALGRSLAQYSRLYANDMIMNFHNEVNLKKAEDIGIKRFLYYGTLIASSRKFCIQRAGKVYTKDQINSWKYKWPGKSGPAMTHRGGYNCRHHWQPVRKKWVEKYNNTEMQSFFKEQGIKTPKQIAPTQTAIEKKVEKVISDIPDSGVIKKELRSLYRTEEQKKIRFRIKELEDLKDAEQKNMLALRDKFTKAGKFSTQKGQDIYEEIHKSSQTLIKYGNEIDLLWNERNNAKAKLIKDRIKPPKGGSVKVGTAYNFDKVTASEFEKFTQMRKEVEEMLHPDVLNAMPSINVRYQKGTRAYYQDGGNLVSFGSFDRTDTFMHEFGHHVEFKYKDYQEKAQEFLKKRTKGEKLTTIYKDTQEKGWKDEFFKHYCGKYYPTGATELMSMGLERMYKDPYGFYQDDREYFDFIIKMMWGVL